MGIRFESAATAGGLQWRAPEQTRASARALAGSGDHEDTTSGPKAVATGNAETQPKASQIRLREGRIRTCRLQQPILVTGETTGDRGAKGRREGSRRNRMREKGRREEGRGRG